MSPLPKAKNVKTKDLKLVLRLCKQALAEQNKRHEAKQSQKRVAATGTMKTPRPASTYVTVDSKLLETHKERTGIGGTRLLIGKTNIPDGLHGAIVSRWISGHTKTAKQHNYEYVLHLYESLPDKRPEKPKEERRLSITHSRTEITPEIQEELNQYREAGLLPRQIFQTIPYDPSNPSPSMVNDWMSGKTKTVNPADLERLLRLCRAYQANQEIIEKPNKVPDRTPKPISSQISRNTQHLRRLRSCQITAKGTHYFFLPIAA
jgi:hypothetical protein